MVNVIKSKNPPESNESNQSDFLKNQVTTKEKEEIVSKAQKNGDTDITDATDSRIKLLRELTKSIIAIALTLTIIGFFAFIAYSSQEPFFNKEEILPILTNIIGVISGYCFAKL